MLKIAFRLKGNNDKSHFHKGDKSHFHKGISDKSHFHKGIKGTGKYKHEGICKIYFALFYIFEIHMNLKKKLTTFLIYNACI